MRGEEHEAGGRVVGEQSVRGSNREGDQPKELDSEERGKGGRRARAREGKGRKEESSSPSCDSDLCNERS